MHVLVQGRLPLLQFSDMHVFARDVEIGHTFELQKIFRLNFHFLVVDLGFHQSLLLLRDPLLKRLNLAMGLLHFFSGTVVLNVSFPLLGVHGVKF